MIKKILIGLAAIFIIFIIIIVMQPNHFRIERSAVIDASPDVLFEQVNDPRKFAEWNPWAKLDPKCKNIYSGPTSGVGATCSWSGNNEVGEGTSTIIESIPGELVRQKMEFKRPMESTCTVDFIFKPEGNKTRVIWAMYGPQLFMGKVMSLFMDCDKMCGDQFEKGLANLDTVVTSASSIK